MEDGYFWFNGKKYKSVHEEVPPITKEMSKEMTIQLGMPYHDLPMFLFDDACFNRSAYCRVQ